MLFAQTHSLFIAQLSRGLMGAGVGFATVAYMKAAAVWFAPRQYAFVGGLLATAAMAGAVFGQAPLALLVDAMGWRDCLFVIGMAGFALAILFVFIVRDKDQSQLPEKQRRVAMKDIVGMLTSKQNWLLTLYSGLAFSPIAIFGGLWGNPFLQEAYQLSSTQAASMISLVFIGLGLGSPLLGLLSDRLGKRKLVMLISTVVSCVAGAGSLPHANLAAFKFAVFIWLWSGIFHVGLYIGKEIMRLR